MMMHSRANECDTVTHNGPMHAIIGICLLRACIPVGSGPKPDRREGRGNNRHIAAWMHHGQIGLHGQGGQG